MMKMIRCVLWFSYLQAVDPKPHVFVSVCVKKEPVPSATMVDQWLTAVTIFTTAKYLNNINA